MSLIHPTAIVDAKAELAESASVGPYAVIEAGVKIGKGCRIGPHCFLTGDTTLGENNLVHAGAVIGDEPQDLAYHGIPTRVVIGNNNRIREHVTIHRGTKEGSATEIGDHNFLMAHCHVAHNCRIGNRVVVVNGVLLAGWVQVEDRAFLGGGAVVHQFCRIGSLAILRGLARISKDVPPYCMAVENNELVGLNVVGLKRAGVSLVQRRQMKDAYGVLFQSGLNVSQALEKLSQGEQTGQIQHLIQFIRQSKRGICHARRKPTDLGEEEDEV
ncbi:MAG: acyl-ACP--UDP-N-acetylglucosamine O-acyltransferase [Verrucomicrobiae bacterium]|nr:acyl-ACP--UDP-N-acetylglucosamine O-acyltransferase [Verrucomicrobiae bacterium]